LRRVKKELQQTKNAVGAFLGGFGIKPMQPLKSSQGDSVIKGNSKSLIKSKDAAKPLGLAGLFGGGAPTPTPVKEAKEVKEVKEPTTKPGTSNLVAKPAPKPLATAPMPAFAKPKPGPRTPVNPTPTKPAKPSNANAKTLKPTNKGPKGASGKKTPKKPTKVAKFGAGGLKGDISEVPKINDIDLDDDLEEVLAEMKAPAETPESSVKADQDSISFNEKSPSPGKNKRRSWAAEEEPEQAKNPNDNVYSRMKLLANYMSVGTRRRTVNLDDEDF
jgi:hypothetical protein